MKISVKDWWQSKRLQEACALLVVLGSVAAAKAAPAITSIRMAGSSPQLTILSTVGATNEIESSSEIAETNWTVLESLVVTQSTYVFVDTRPGTAPQRYYRVIEPTPRLGPPGMVLIPAGTFDMGDTFNEGASYELPVHAVYVSAFYLGQYEVTKELWDGVYNWSLTNGYAYDNPGSGKAANHPVQSINWYDMVKWCNARS